MLCELIFTCERFTNGSGLFINVNYIYVDVCTTYLHTYIAMLVIFMQHILPVSFNSIFIQKRSCIFYLTFSEALNYVASSYCP